MGIWGVIRRVLRSLFSEFLRRGILRWVSLLVRMGTLESIFRSCRRRALILLIIFRDRNICLFGMFNHFTPSFFQKRAHSFFQPELYIHIARLCYLWWIFMCHDWFRWDFRVLNCGMCLCLIGLEIKILKSDFFVFLWRDFLWRSSLNF